MPCPACPPPHPPPPAGGGAGARGPPPLCTPPRCASPPPPVRLDHPRPLVDLVLDEHSEGVRRAADRIAAERREALADVGQLEHGVELRVELLRDLPVEPGRRQQPLPELHPEIGKALLGESRHV